MPFMSPYTVRMRARIYTSTCINHISEKTHKNYHYMFLFNLLQEGQKYSLNPLPPNKWLCFYMVTGIAALFFSYALYTSLHSLMLSCLTEICILSLHINKNEDSSLNKPFNTWLTVDSCIITVTTSTVAVSKVKTVPQSDL